MLEGVVVFSGATISGPPVEPSPAPEGDVFSGASIAGPSSGGSNLGSGGTLFPPGPGLPSPAPPSTALTLTAIPSAIIAAYQRYSQYSVAYGGIPPYSYFITAGAIPPGSEFDTSNGDIGNIAQVYSGALATSDPFSYTVTVQDSTGIVSFTVTGGGTYNGTAAAPNDSVAGSITTPADNQTVMIVCVTANDSTASDINEVASIVTSNPSLAFTRIFHDASFTYTDSGSDGANPVASFSIDIFTAPAPTQITAAIGWHGVMTGGSVTKGATFVLSVGGLKDISTPLDPAGSLPSVAMNTSGTSSAPSNTVTTSVAGDTLFSLIINHDGSGDAAAVPPPGFATIGNVSNVGLASGFSLLLSFMPVTEIQSATTITAGFSDNFWYQAIFGFEGAGGSPLTASQTINVASVEPVTPGSQTFTEGSGYFFAPPYNTLTVEVWGGSETGSQVRATYGALTAAGVDGFAETVYTPSTDGAPPVTGAMPYSVGTGSPSGMITFTWS